MEERDLLEIVQREKNDSRLLLNDFPKSLEELAKEMGVAVEDYLLLEQDKRKAKKHG